MGARVRRRDELRAGLRAAGAAVAAVGLGVCRPLRTRLDRGRRHDRSRVLVLPPADVGSLGDEAMVVAVVDQLLAGGAEPVVVVSYGNARPWSRHPTLGTDDTVQHLRVAGLVGKLRLFWQLAGADQVACLGADVLDGFYDRRSALRRLWVLDIAARAGIRSTVVGFSFNSTPDAVMVAAFRALPERVRLLLRDPVSFRRFAAAVGRPAELAADVAFLLEPSPSGATSGPIEWIRAAKAAGRTTIGVNANGLLGRELDGSIDVATLYQRVVALVAEARPDIALVFLPHDYRVEVDRPSDLWLVNTVAAGLDPGLGDRCFVVEREHTAAELKAIAAECDLVLTGRMHLAIAALSQGVPTVSVAYQGKFEGLYEHLDLAGMSFGADAQGAAERLADALVAVVADLPAMRSRLAEALPRVRSLAAANVAAVGRNA